MTAATHVVFGTGPPAAVATPSSTRAPSSHGQPNGTPALTGVETIGGDATDLDFARRGCRRHTVYFCLNAPTTTAGPRVPATPAPVLGAASQRTPSSSSSRTCTCTAHTGPPRDHPGQPDEREEPDPRRHVR